MIGEILQLLVLALALVAYFRYARRLKGSLYLIFTALSSATLLLSLTYYLAHTYIREGMRVPFAANDIADFGTFLLMSTALCSAVGTEWGRFRGSPQARRSSLWPIPVCGSAGPGNGCGIFSAVSPSAISSASASVPSISPMP